MLMVYIDNVTYRVEYLFKFLLTSILGINISLTSEIETFIDHRKKKDQLYEISFEKWIIF